MNSNLEKFKDRLKNIEQNRFKKKTEPKGLGIGMKIGLDLISPYYCWNFNRAWF